MFSGGSGRGPVAGKYALITAIGPHGIEPAIEPALLRRLAKGKMVVSRRKQIVLPDPAGSIELGPIFAVGQLCEIVIENPLLQDHRIHPPQHQPVHLSLLLGDLLVTGILVSHAGKGTSQHLTGPLEGTHPQCLHVVQSADVGFAEGEHPIVEGDHRLRQEDVVQHAGFDVDDGIELAGLQHAEGALQRQIFELRLIAAVPKCLSHQVELDPATLFFDHIGRDGEADPHS